SLESTISVVTDPLSIKSLVNVSSYVFNSFAKVTPYFKEKPKSSGIFSGNNCFCELQAVRTRDNSKKRNNRRSIVTPLNDLSRIDVFTAIKLHVIVSVPGTGAIVKIRNLSGARNRRNC